MLAIGIQDSELGPVLIALKLGNGVISQKKKDNSPKEGRENKEMDSF